MACPIGSSGCQLPHDVSVIEERHRRVLLQGRIYAVVAPDEADYSPFGDWFAASLCPRKGRVKYLKFAAKEELDRWELAPGDHIECRGCLHCADGREVVFDVTVIR
jgi:hypothetical protein